MKLAGCDLCNCHGHSFKQEKGTGGGSAGLGSLDLLAGGGTFNVGRAKGSALACRKLTGKGVREKGGLLGVPEVIPSSFG